MKSTLIILLITLLISCDESTGKDSNKIPDDALVAHYKLDGNANDESDNSHDGTFIGSVSTTTDRNGTANSAQTFNGTSSYIKVTGIDANDFEENTMTVTFWTKIDDFNNDASYPIFSKENDTPEGETVDSEYAFKIDANGIDFDYFGRVNTTIKTGSWIFIAIRVELKNAILSIDNALIGNTGNVSETDNTRNFSVSNKQFNIGAALTKINSYFKGTIDDFRIYNIILNDAQVKNVSKD